MKHKKLNMAKDKERLTVLVTEPDTEELIRRLMEIKGWNKQLAGNSMILLAAKLFRLEDVTEADNRPT